VLQNTITGFFYGEPHVGAKFFSSLESKLSIWKSNWFLYSSRIVVLLDPPKIMSEESIKKYDYAIKFLNKISIDLFDNIEYVQNDQYLGPANSLAKFLDDDTNTTTPLLAFFDVNKDKTITSPMVDPFLIIKFLLCDDDVNYFRFLQQPECAPKHNLTANVTVFTHENYGVRLDDHQQCKPHVYSKKVRRIFEISDNSHFATWDFYSTFLIPYVKKASSEFPFYHGIGRLSSRIDLSFIRDYGLWAFNISHSHVT